MSRARSLDANALCGIDEDGEGTYSAEGIVAISEMLKVNTTLQSIRCVAHVRFLADVSSPCQCSVSAHSSDHRIHSVLVCSIGSNFICYGGEMSCLVALCEMLKTNGSLRELK